ncbi:hypothetical protein C8J57DRAFT_1704042 [Mycena rebaudengoi]|nr:hypothetical protein C8J57DRAFT_1704042 [Mycena rebaudengoi]
MPASRSGSTRPPAMQTVENSAQAPMAAEETTLSQLLEVSRIVILQGIDLLDNHLNNSYMTTQSMHLPGSTIGKHLRHSRDHFELLLDCITSPPPHVFSYDTRIRNTPMEQDRDVAKKALLSTLQRLEEVVPGSDPKTLLTLQAVTPTCRNSTPALAERQLWFAVLHCVHHWSMVRVIAGELNIKLAEDFGFAPSTLVYQGREAPLGRAMGRAKI